MSNFGEGYRCKICGEIIPLTEKDSHEQICKPSQNTIKQIIYNNSFNNKTIKSNISKTNEKLNSSNNYRSLTFPLPSDGHRIRINSNVREGNSVTANVQANENINRYNNYTITNNNANNNNSTSTQNEEVLNMVGIEMVRNIQSNFIRPDILPGNENVYYSYSHNNENTFIFNSLDENGNNEEIFDFDSILINNRNNPVETKIVESLIINEIKDIKKLSVDRCTICLGYFENGDKYIALPCIHIFHPNCIYDWMKRKNICPNCKYLLTYTNICDTNQFNQ